MTRLSEITVTHTLDPETKAALDSLELKLDALTAKLDALGPGPTTDHDRVDAMDLAIEAAAEHCKA